jgi:hypothetical protein
VIGHEADLGCSLSSLIDFLSLSKPQAEGNIHSALDPRMDTSNDSTDAANAEGGGSDQTHTGLSPSRELLRNPLSRSPIGSTTEKTTPPPTKDGGEEKREQVPHEDGERSRESFDEEENKVEMEDEPGHTSAELQRAEETKNPDDGISKPEVEGEKERDEECIVDHITDSSTAEDTGGEKKREMKSVSWTI